MMYKIGDKISHTVHGAGVISNIETKEILGEETSYYTIEIPANKMKLMVATEKADEIGIRKIMGKKELAVVLEGLTIPLESKKINWMERTRENEVKLASGNINQVMEVYKELYKLDNEKGLSSTEKRMYNTAKQILVSEVSLVNKITSEEAENLMKDTLNKTLQINI